MNKFDWKREGRILATKHAKKEDRQFIYFIKKQKFDFIMVARTAREILRWLESLYLTYPVVVPKWYVKFLHKHFIFLL